MKEKTTYTVYLINHDVEDVAWTVLDANHRIHAARKAEKVLGRGWEADHRARRPVTVSEPHTASTEATQLAV